jgi:hypothetical protein
VRSHEMLPKLSEFEDLIDRASDEARQAKREETVREMRELAKRQAAGEEFFSFGDVLKEFKSRRVQ